MNGETEDASGTTDSLGYILGEGDQFAFICALLLYRKIDLKLLHKLIDGIWTRSPIEQFYVMPVLIYACWLAQKYIHHDAAIFEP